MNTHHINTISIFKTLFFALLVTGCSTVYANSNDHLKNTVMKSFEKEFYNAKDVKWEEQKDYIRISFLSEGKAMFAYYTKAGEQIAVTKNLLTSDLPYELAASLKHHKSYLVVELFELSADGELCYYATLTNGQKSITLKSQGQSGWQTYDPAKK